MEPHRVAAVLTAALECSIYHSPIDPGLTREELFEVGNRLGCEQGEMEDALPTVATACWGQTKVLPDPTRSTLLPDFHDEIDPDYRNFAAFETVHSGLKAAVRSMGVRSAAIERSVLVEQGAAKGVARLAMEAAITVCCLWGILSENAGVLRYVLGRETWPLPSQQRAQPRRTLGPLRRNEMRRAAYQAVGDVISRRTDGRSRAAEPLPAFGEVLAGLGYGQFRLWWAQQVSELSLSEAHSTPVATCVLAASLVEGALTFTVRHARALGLAVFGSKDFDREPQHWKIDDLVRSAAHGGPDAILGFR